MLLVLDNTSFLVLCEMDMYACGIMVSSQRLIYANISSNSEHVNISNLYTLFLSVRSRGSIIFKLSRTWQRIFSLILVINVVKILICDTLPSFLYINCLLLFLKFICVWSSYRWRLLISDYIEICWKTYIFKRSQHYCVHKWWIDVFIYKRIHGNIR